jgi:hypothetical protein
MQSYQQQPGISYYKDLDDSIESQMSEMVVSDTRRTHKIHWVNVYNFDKAWAHASQYLAPGTQDPSMEKAETFLKMDPVNRHRKYGRYIMPAVKVGIRWGEVKILDGRHRYCILREAGVEKMPVSMDNDSAKNAGRLNLLWTSFME